MGPWSTGENKPRTRLNHGPKAKWVSGISSEYISQSECHMGWKVRRQAWPQGPGGPEWLMWGGQGRACPLREALESNLRKWKEGVIVPFVLLVWLTSCWDGENEVSRFGGYAVIEGRLSGGFFIWKLRARQETSSRAHRWSRWVRGRWEHEPIFLQGDRAPMKPSRRGRALTWAPSEKRLDSATWTGQPKGHACTCHPF